MGNRLSLQRSSVNIDDNCLLHVAVKRGDKKAVKSVASQCDVNAVDINGRTALYVASEKGLTKIAALLLDKGAHVDQVCTGAGSDSVESLISNGFAPLHVAAERGHLDCVQLLLSRGADVDVLGRGYTPFQFACLGGHFSVASELLSRGADINAVSKPARRYTKDPKTPYFECFFLDSRQMGLLSPVSHGILRAVRSSEWNVLHYAAMARDSEAAKLLLRKGVGVNVEIPGTGRLGGLVPLHLAVLSGNEENVQLLLNSNADVNVKSRGGLTPLHLACKISSCVSSVPGIIELLLEWGADISAEDANGKIPLQMFLGHWQQCRHDRPVAELFAKHFAKRRALDLFVDETNVQAISEHSEYVRFGARCDQEIRRMRRRTIADSTIRYFDVLAGDHRRLADYAAGEGVAEVLASKSLARDFPIFAGQIRKRFDQGRARVDLQRQSDAVLSLGDLRVLPHDCLRKLNSYLSDEDRRNVIRAKPIRQRRTVLVDAAFKRCIAFANVKKVFTSKNRTPRNLSRSGSCDGIERDVFRFF